VGRAQLSGGSAQRSVPVQLLRETPLLGEDLGAMDAASISLSVAEIALLDEQV